MTGIDEVGRGAWAGPLLVVAAKVKLGFELPIGLTDSKLLSRTKREILYDHLLQVCDFGEGWASEFEIDAKGISLSMRVATLRAIRDLGVDFGEPIIIDGTVNFLPSDFLNVKTLVKADLAIPIVSAASIYAKVVRDRYMREISRKYPEYGFDQHVGYGTQKHINAIKEFGVTPIHRRSYKPVANYLSIRSLSIVK